MFERCSRQSAAIDSSRAWSGAGAASLVIHALVVSGLGGLYEPVAPGPPNATATAAVDLVTIIDLTPGTAVTSTEADASQPSIPEAAPSPEELPASTDPGAPPAEAGLPPPPSDGSPEAAAPRVLFPRPARDPRLHVGAGTLGAGRLESEPAAITARLNAALSAVPDSMEAQARREASMGYARRYGQITLGNGKLIMPMDGPVWQAAQMMTYNEAAVRDSILQDRVGVMRERADSARAGRPGH